MAKRRLYELAKERGLSSAELLEALKSAGVEGKSALSTMEESEVDAALREVGIETRPEPAASDNGQGPSEAAPVPVDRPAVGDRIRMRRRLRHLRRVHQSQLTELAELAVELYRLDSPRQDDLAAERLKAAAETEDELVQIEQRLGSNEVSVECESCGLHTKRTRYCLRCGAKLPTAHGPQNLSATGAVVAIVAIAVAWLLGGINFGSHSQNAAKVTRPVQQRAVRHGPSFRSYVATVTGPKIGIFHSPTDPAPYTHLSSPNGDGATVAFLVKQLQRDWAYVYLPTRPNGSMGWIRRSKVKISGDNFHVKINLTRKVLTAWKGKQRVLKTPVGVGRAVTPTPPGLYYITELLKPTDPTGTYGPYAFGLSAHSNVLHEFAGGDGVLGLHGTNFPAGIGTNVSHGCIRMSNKSIIKLAHTLPIGTPVRIVGTV